MGKLEKICGSAVQKFNDLSEWTKTVNARIMKKLLSMKSMKHEYVALQSKNKKLYAKEAGKRKCRNFLLLKIIQSGF